MAVLAARRAATTGLDVVVATSSAESDDELVRTLDAAGLPVFRGELADPLRRVAGACADLDAEDLVIRLTADNVVPDGTLLSSILEQRRSSDAEYLAVEWPSSGLPYGVSAEVFRVRSLRAADRFARDAPDREHVTPWIRQAHGVAPFRSPLSVSTAGARCTVDTFDDYVDVCRLFEHVDDPVAARWDRLCVLLKSSSRYGGRLIPRRATPHGLQSELVLGTAQLGPSYGIANFTGQLDMDEATSLVRGALAAGVSTIDTARAYGDSEARLGAALAGGLHSRVRIVTKLSPLSHLSPGASVEAVEAAVEASIFRSCRELRTSRLDVVLVHRVAHLSSWGGVCWRRLMELRDEGVISALGASAGTVEDVRLALADPGISYLQLPVNLLDHRWREGGVPDLLMERPDVSVHARSALLQGLLALNEPDLWPAISRDDAGELVRVLNGLAVDHSRAGVVDLCLAYVRGLPWVDGLVLGMDRQAHVDEAVELFQRPALSLPEVQSVERSLPRAPDALLDPSLWGREQ